MIQNIFKTHRLLLLSLISGLLLSLSWPSAGFPFLALISLVPLFFIEDHILQNRSQYHRYSVFLHAWVAFLVFNLLTTWWIFYATLPGMLVAVFLNSLFMAIPWALMHQARRVLPGKQGPLSIVVFWLAFEHLHSLWELSWSWLDLGNVFASVPRWVQWYEYTGAAGGTLWILVINLLIFLLLKSLLEQKYPLRRVVWYSIFLAAGLVTPVLISFSIWRGYQELPDPVEIVVLQPNQDPYSRADTPQEVQQRIEQMLDLTRTQITPQTRFVVAPEGASPTGIWAGEEEGHPMIQAIRGFQQEHPQAAWIFGSATYQMYASVNQAPANARPYGSSPRYYQAFNSAVLVAEGLPARFYHKSKLVPGIERMPFFSLIKPLGTLVENLGGISGSLGTQPQRTVFTTAQHAVAPVICYESIYGDYMQDYITGGASLIFIITNDGWWRNTPGYRQHNQYARLRAIESRRSIARAASTGISSFIDQKGNIIQSTSWWETHAMRASLNQNQQLTFFTLNGNFLGRLSVFVMILLLFFMISQGIIKKQTARGKK